MEELLNLGRTKSSSTVKGNIDRFESLSISEPGDNGRSNSSKSKRSVLEVTSSSSNGDNSLTSAFDLAPSTVSKESTATSVSNQPPSKKHQKHESVAFLQKSYLDRDSLPEQDTLPDDAREILKSQPDYEDLLAVLQYLECGIQRKHDFNIHITGPKAAQIINALVTVTIPDHWPVLRIHKLPNRQHQLKKLLVLSLRSVAGIGALLMQIRKLSSVKRADNSILEDILSVLELVLHGNQFINTMIRDARGLYLKETNRRLCWQEVVSMTGGSKILSFVAQATTTAGISSNKLKWLSEGDEYSKWLAKNISAATSFLSIQDDEAWTMLAHIARRALNLGYRDILVSEMYHSLLLGKAALWTPLRQLLRLLSNQEQRLFFDAMLRDLVRKYLRYGPVTYSMQKNGLESESNVGGVAGMVAGVLKNNIVLEDHLVQWLTSTTGEYASLGLDTRRAVIATLALRQGDLPVPARDLTDIGPDKLQTILDKCLETFGSKTQIQHSPILQQESIAEIILLAVGYMYRQRPESIKQLSQSGVFLQTVSNRLSASVPRSRFLGMIVATAISKLVDAKAMDFGMEEMEGEAAGRWLSLVNINDTVGQIEDLKPRMPQPEHRIIDIPNPVFKAKKSATQPERSKIIAIEEEDDEDEDSEDDDLIPYAKPDEDPSDSDEDPTLINRDKPAAPIYIIDLIKQLQADEKFDAVDLALKTAPSLIRRKANFGTELSDNVQFLASTLLNLKSPTLDSDEMHHLRLQSLIACLISQPDVIGPWLASMYFEGDYSLDQRASILTTIGLGARELAGLSDPPPSASASQSQNPTDKNEEKSFPSRRLPPHLSSAYTNPISTLSHSLTHKTMQPLALAAADKLSGPDILKIRTFSSRLEVQKRAAEKQTARSKRIPKNLHNLLARSFFLPLCTRLNLILSIHGGAGVFGRSGLFDPSITRLFLQTLLVVLNALGPNALHDLLGEVSREAVNLLVAIYARAVLVSEKVVLEAVMALLLGVLEINVANGRGGEERLLADVGEPLAALVGWVGMLLDRGGSGGEQGEGEGLAWNVLAAGVMVRWQEIGERWQGRMLGLMGVENWDGT